MVMPPPAAVEAISRPQASRLSGLLRRSAQAGLGSSGGWADAVTPSRLHEGGLLCGWGRTE